MTQYLFNTALVTAFQLGPSTVMLPVYMVVGIGITIAAILPFVAICWIDETLAELFAISKIGRTQYRSVLDEVKEESSADLLHKIRLRIQYPPDALILWIASKKGIGG